MVEEIISASLSLAGAEPLKLKEYGGKDKSIRSQLHVMALMPFGAGKTTLINALPKKAIVNMTDYSYPGLVGTITKQGQMIDGYVKQAAGKTLIVDEFHNIGDKPRLAMLSLLDGQSYHRTLGFKLLAKPKDENKKFWKISYGDNFFDINYIRFACMAIGIYQPRKTINDWALISRFMPLNIEFTLDDIIGMATGKPSLQLDNIKYEPMKETPYFEDYLKFVTSTVEILKATNLLVKIGEKTGKMGLFPRFLGDFSRLFSWASRGNSTITDWEKYLSWIPVIMKNYFAATLTATEINIMNATKDGLTGKETAIKCQCSETYVSDTLKKLRGVELVQ